MKNLAYYNGRIEEASKMMVPAEDRAFYFGDGVYDVTTVHNGKCFAMQDHLTRFYGNCRKLRLNLGMTMDEVKAICEDLVSKLDPDVKEAVLYFQASRGTAPRNHAFPENAKANLYFTLKEAPFKEMGRKVQAVTKEDIRFEMCDIKTLNLLFNVLAQQEAVEKGAYECILHRGERVTEGSHSGVSILKDGVFQTPPLDRFILPSVTRKHYIELCTGLGIRVLEKPFTVEEMMNADEVIIMSSTAVCNVCESIDGTPVGGKAPELIRQICDAYKEKVFAETGMKY